MADKMEIGGLTIVNDNSGTKLFQSRKEDFEEMVAAINCSEYQPCPICFKCMVKAGHQYLQCEECQVPLCHHKASDRYKMIRPSNFTIEVNKGELRDSILKDVAEYKLNKEEK